MLWLVIALIGGSLIGWLTLAALRPIFNQPVFARENYSGKVLPTSVGLVLPVALIVAEGFLTLIGTFITSIEIAPSLTLGADSYRHLTLALVIGLGFLGLIDDLAGTSDIRGFRGHLTSMRDGVLTTGGLKLLGGACIAMVVCVFFAGSENLSPLYLLRDASLVALAANLGNLFDRAPGRVIKVSTLAFVIVGATVSYKNNLIGPAIVFGTSLSLLVGDLKERFMLGDAGSNVLGGALGFALVISTPPSLRLIALVVVFALNLAAERVSFSDVISRIAPLRALDQLGRKTPL
ncbi:MAG: hypothetical protein ACSLFB_10195 [Acidimicrobiales bacterium]